MGKQSKIKAQRRKEREEMTRRSQVGVVDEFEGFERTDKYVIRLPSQSDTSGNRGLGHSCGQFSVVDLVEVKLGPVNSNCVFK